MAMKAMPSFLMEQTAHALGDAVRPSGLVELSWHFDDDGEDQRDQALSFDFRLIDEDWIRSFGLPLPRNDKHAQAYGFILLQAFFLAQESTEHWISYSRRKEWYTRRQRYRHPACSFATVPDVVDGLTSLGLLEHDKAYPGRWGKQSRFRAAPALQRVSPPAAIWEPYELIRLRNKDKDLINYRDTKDTIRMHRTIKYLNKMLCRASITIRESAITDQQEQLATISTPNGKIIVNLALNKLYRVFNNSSFDFGGRFYGPFWQNLPKSIRAMLLIDGEAVNERDYRQLHPKLLYAQVGVTLEDKDDAYTIDGVIRRLAKRGFNIAINAETKLAAIRALALEIRGEGAHAKACDLLDVLVTKHVRIASYFGSGAGLRLQRHDADLAERVMLELVKRGIIVLPVHDSFIVQRRHA